MVIVYIFLKCKGLSDKNVTPTVAPNYSLTLKLSYFGTKTRTEFSGSS